MGTAKLYNLARMTTATTGTGTITLGAAVPGFLTFAAAGVANGDVVTYAIRDGGNSEIGRGTYTASGTTLTRSVLRSTNANAAIGLSGAAEVFITAAKEDFDTNDFTAESAVAPDDKFPFHDTSAGGSRAVTAANLIASFAATQAEQETGTATDRIVTAGRQHFHPSAVKAWVKFQGDGTVTINDDYGVSTVGDGGQGEYAINLSPNFENGNYAAAGMARRVPTDGTDIVTVCVHRASSPTTSQLRIVTVDDANVRIDAREVHVHVCGNLP